MDNNNIHIRPRYIKSAAKTWADKLSRHLDNDDRQLDRALFHKMDNHFGRHTIHRFASALNTLLPRYNANWLDPSCEAVDALHLSDTNCRDENNWCNPPWPLLPDLAQKLRQSGAKATMVAPRWQGKAWQKILADLA
jgi:hypothetical protein